MNNLALRPLWMTIGLAGLALLVFLSLTRLPHHVLLFTYGDKLEHIAAFACVQLWFAQLYPSRKARLILLAMFLAAALGLEVGQRAIGGFKSLEWGDVVASWFGLLLANWASARPPFDNFLGIVERGLLK